MIKYSNADGYVINVVFSMAKPATIFMDVTSKNADEVHELENIAETVFDACRLCGQKLSFSATISNNAVTEKLKKLGYTAE